MEDKILKFATAVVVVLTVAVCIGLPFFPQIHTWAVESREERLAEQEYAENQTEMKDLEIVAADTSEQVHGGQLQLKLPEGINGSDIQFTNDYVTQTIKISIPGTDRSYFENGPITGSSNHIATLSYSSKGEDGVIEIVMDHVYELKTEYDSAYYYFDFLTPQEVYDKVVVIDAGHGGRAPGANKQGVNEKEIDLDIVLQLKRYLMRMITISVFIIPEPTTATLLLIRGYSLQISRTPIFLSAYITIPQTVEECPRQMVQQSCITSRMRANLEVSGWHRSV